MMKRALLVSVATLAVVSAFGSLAVNACATEILPAESAVIGSLGEAVDSATPTSSGLVDPSLQLGSVAETTNVGGSLSSSQADTLTMPDNMTYVQPNNEVDVMSFVTTPTSPTSAGGPVDGDLTASTVVPEPASLLLFGAGLIGFAGISLIRRRGRRPR